MARHQVEINPFDPSSLDAARQELEKMVKEFDRKVERLLDRLAEIAVNTAQGIYGGATSVTVQKTEKGRTVTAVGTDAAYFIEFGTGAYTGENSGLYISVPQVVYKGSYSEIHAQRWQDWIAAGNSEESFPFNQHPQSAMYKAYEAVCTNYARIVREVFSA